MLKKVRGEIYSFILGFFSCAATLLDVRLFCIRDGSPEGREGRPCPALGPLGGETVAPEQVRGKVRATVSCRESPPRARAGTPLSNYSKNFNCLASGYDLAVDLRGMDFLVIPDNAVLNVRVLDDAVVADGYVGADGAVLDDHVLADVARGNQLDVVHGLVLADDVANVVEMGPVLE